jgi:hypothetical protein
MKEAFLQALDEAGLTFGEVTTTAGVYDLQNRLLNGREPDHNITLCTFTEYFPAVATTDILCRVADVLTCKPSELAFACVPKLHIRRVGDHEADSARRAAELGDGTLEAREVSDALDYIDLFLHSTLLTEMNETILKQHSIKVYHGCQVAVEKVLEKGGALGK